MRLSVELPINFLILMVCALPCRRFVDIPMLGEPLKTDSTNALCIGLLRLPLLRVIQNRCLPPLGEALPYF